MSEETEENSKEQENSDYSSGSDGISSAGIVITISFAVLMGLLFLFGSGIMALDLASIGMTVIVFFVVVVLLSGIRINNEWQRAVILRLGKYKRTKASGLFYVIPLLEWAGRLDTRTQVMDVESQKIITKDSVTVEVNAMVYYKVESDEAKKAILEVENWKEASTILAQTTLRDIVGQHDLDALLTEKSKIGGEIKTILDKETDPWSIKVSSVEIKDVIIPDNMERAMAKEAEAIREKRSRIVKAEGELEASKKLKQAGDMLAKNKNAIELRKLQTYQEIGAEQNSLIIVTGNGEFPHGLAPLVELMNDKKKKK